MTQPIPTGYGKSPALRLVISQGWSWSGPNGSQLSVDNCPFCLKAGGKFYIAVSTDEEIEGGNTRDGLFFCHKCQITGNLRLLQEKLGLRIAGVESKKEWAGSSTAKVDSLPDVELCHAALLGSAEAMDYLIHTRGFSKEVIERYKLGLKEKVYFRKAGETRALVIPYLSNEGNVTFAKFRTLPPAEKDFVCPSGYEAGLYNSPALNEDCKEIIMVEGEADTLSLLSNRVENVVGVPGAGVHKAAWIEALDKINPKIYILFDSDKAGNKGAQALANRIGVERCLKIELPKDVKDINAYFQGGGTVEGFEALKANATLFDVNGVHSSKDAISQLEDELNGKVDLAPTYVTQWPELNKLVGLEEGDVFDLVAPGKVGKSTLSLNLIDHFVATYNEPGLIVSLEMTPARLAKKWISMLTGFEDVLTVPGSPEAAAKLKELKENVVKARNIQQSREADLYFAYPSMVKEPEDVFKLIRDCIRRYGVKFVVFDNIQLLCDNTLGNRQGFRTVQLSQISKGFSKLAKDHKIVLVRILQPKKIEKGSMISTGDVDGSSQIDKDCDAMATLWRQPVGVVSKSAYEQEEGSYSESEESFSPKMRVTVGLSRYSSGGHCDLYFDGARSQVRSYDNAQKTAMKQQFNNLVPGQIPMENGSSVPVVPTTEIPI
jgi:5S rRNA maturation endonuclease (ribonuclease M5)